MRQKIVNAIQRRLQDLVDLGVAEPKEVEDVIDRIKRNNNSEEEDNSMKLYTKREISKMFGCCPKTVERIVSQNKLTPIYLNKGRIIDTPAGKRKVGASIRFRHEDVVEFLKSMESKNDNFREISQ